MNGMSVRLQTKHSINLFKVNICFLIGQLFRFMDMNKVSQKNEVTNSPLQECPNTEITSGYPKDARWADEELVVTDSFVREKDFKQPEPPKVKQVSINVDTSSESSTTSSSSEASSTESEPQAASSGTKEAILLDEVKHA